MWKYGIGCNIFARISNKWKSWFGNFRKHFSVHQKTVRCMCECVCVSIGTFSWSITTNVNILIALPERMEKVRLENMTLCQKVSCQLVKQFMNDSPDSTSLLRCIHKWNNWKLIYRNRMMELSWLVSNVGTFIQYEMNFWMSGKIMSNFYWCTRSVWRRHCCDKRESVGASGRMCGKWRQIFFF